MNLRSVDLNLLVVLDALLDEAHVSRAADRLGLSQPAASSALERCRHLFNDPLLERGRGRMRLTAKAEALRAPVKNVLAEIVAVLDPPAIDLATVRQTVRIVMADYPAVVIAGALHKALAETAPGIDLIIQPWHGANEALDGLAKGTIDLAASVFPKTDASFQRHELLREHYVVIMRKDHPAADGFDLDKWLAYPHVLVSGRGHTKGPLDDVLTTRGRERRVGIVVPSFVMVPALLADFRPYRDGAQSLRAEGCGKIRPACSADPGRRFCTPSCLACPSQQGCGRPACRIDCQKPFEKTRQSSALSRSAGLCCQQRFEFDARCRELRRFGPCMTGDQHFGQPHVLCHHIAGANATGGHEPAVLCKVKKNESLIVQIAADDACAFIDETRDLQAKLILIRPEPRNRPVRLLRAEHIAGCKRALFLRIAPRFEPHPAAAIKAERKGTTSPAA